VNARGDCKFLINGMDPPVTTRISMHALSHNLIENHILQVVYNSPRACMWGLCYET